jgi:hypothetical protein
VILLMLCLCIQCQFTNFLFAVNEIGKKWSVFHLFGCLLVS